MSAERERITLHNGNEWRIHYWRLEKNTILRYSNTRKQKGINKYKETLKQKSRYESIYSDITPDMWSSRKTIDV
ncbi:MAG: hypothetical protein DRO67_07570 [Candidatus Asgardarchaeum californiense]|nr:MAG: hypothetical protein DRO67_07570 [Candidatus Asgardarchaeum californiense]